MIDSRVGITMTNKTTIRASESSFGEGHRCICSAPATPLTATSCLGVFQQLSTANYCFVGKHMVEFTPCNVKYVLSEVALNHSFDIKLLAIDDCVIFSQGMAEFVQEISPLVSNFQVLPCNFDTGFLPVFAAFDTPRMDALQPCEFLFSINIESRVDDRFPVIVSQEFSQTNIDANLCSGRMFIFRNINFAAEDCKPLPCIVTLDCESFNLTFRDTVQYDWQTANLGYPQSFIVEKLEPFLRISDRLDFRFESRKSCFSLGSFLALLNPIKEVVKRFMQPIGNVLQYLGMCLCNIRRTYLDIPNKRIEIVFVRGIKFLALVKQSVISFFDNLKLIEKAYLLFPRRIHPVLIHFHELHTRGERQWYI